MTPQEQTPRIYTTYATPSLDHFISQLQAARIAKEHTAEETWYLLWLESLAISIKEELASMK